MGITIEGLKTLREIGVKMADLTKEGEVIAVEFFPMSQPVLAAQLPGMNDMPPDDVMLFAATEDPEELMKALKKE